MLASVYLGLCSTIFAQNQQQAVEIPDANLRSAVRKALKLTDEIPLTQLEMLRLKFLSIWDKDITDLTGLEHATFLSDLGLCRNQIHNLHALSGLIHLEHLSLCINQISDITPLENLINLKSLDLGWNHNMSDIAPLAKLTQLEVTNLSGNSIVDISPLAELTNLVHLNLANNQIVDFDSLANLINLRELWINNNLGIDISPLEGLNLIDFYYDASCDIEPLQPLIRERIENRGFPSVFQAWDDVVGLNHLTWEQRNVLHDLHFSSNFELNWYTTLAEPTFGVATQIVGNLARARAIRQRRLDQNPNMVFLVEIRVHNHFTSEAFPPNSDYWLRDAQGQIVRNAGNEYVIDFLKPEVQELIVKRTIAIARCGLYDGVMIDGFNGNGTGFVDREYFYSVTDEEIIQIMLNIFQAVRSQVSDDFLILVNANRSKATRFSQYVNGTFMETGTDYPGGYTPGGLAEIENTLLWSDENLRAPQINCLEGWGIPTEASDSPNNLRWMRVFTTMSLTHSDGYVMYNTGTGVIRLPDSDVNEVFSFEPGHEHLWFSFWDVDLGRPVGEKGVQYQNRDGLFIREFTNGWAVYNRSGETQQIDLFVDVTGVASGEQGRIHLLPDLDGEIYLKVANQSPWDVNQDGITDIFDLISVAKNFGKDHPDTDLNNDGNVDIFDLVLVAKHLGDSTNPAAPVIGTNSHLLTSKTVQGWIDMAQLAHDGSPVFRQGIANLKHLLTTLVPDKTVLLSNYPNPFNPETWIPYHLAADADLTITIYGLGGELVRRLDLGLQEAGYYVDKNRAVHWDGTNEDGESVASGVYFIKMKAGEIIASKRMVVVK